jgi:hypothetical protein
MVLGDNVGDSDPPAGNQDAENLGEHGRFVDRQVDHTVGDHHVSESFGPGRLAESNTSIPPPEPRSSTRSPGCSSAAAVGFDGGRRVAIADLVA